MAAEQAAPAAEAPAPEAPEMDAAPAMDAEPSEEAPMDAAPMDEQAPPEGDPAMGDEAPLSVEQLVELYGDMPEEELSMHYEALKQALQKTWMKQAMEKGEYPTDKKANGGEIKSGSEMAKKEQLAAAKPAAAAMEKTEDKEQIEKLEASVGSLIKALEAKLPARKSITEVVEEGTKPQEPTLSGKDLQEKAKDLPKQSLAKSERELLNSFFVTGKGEEQVRELIKGKKA
jgi:hypothetical protein